MESEPSEFVCIDCNLRFKNSGTYEKHKRKFCQGRREKSWSPSTRKVNLNGSAVSYFNGGADMIARPVASSDFWAGKSNTALGLLPCSRQRAFSNEERTPMHRYDSFKQITINSKYNSEIEELVAEQNKLEQHKRAIQEKLASMKVGKNRAMTIDTPLGVTNRTERRQQNGGRSIEEKITDLHQFLSRQQSNNQRNGSRRENSQTFFDGYLSHINQLKQEYIQEGGNDLKILSMLHNLETDAYKNDASLNTDDSNLVQKLQNQLIMYQKTNQSLMEQLQNISRQRDPRYDPAYLQPPVQERNVVRHDLANFHEQRLLEMRQEAEMYRQQLELERLKSELLTLRGGLPQPHPLPPLPQLPAAPQTNAPQNMIVSEMEMMKLPKETELSEDIFQRAPYDPGNGFALFWDFLCGIPLPSERCRIAVTMFQDGKPVSDVRFLPTVPCNKPNDSIVPGAKDSGRMAVLGVKQVFPRCMPTQSLTIAAQVQMGSQYDASFESMQEVGWSNLDIFDNSNRVISGRWKVPVRVPPFDPRLSPAELNAIQQLDGCELYYRLVNVRDMETQEAIVLKAQQTNQYKYPPLERQSLPPSTNLHLEPLRTMLSRPDTVEKPRKKSTKHRRVSPPPSPPIFSPAPVVPSSPGIERQRKEPSPKPITPAPIKQPTPKPPPKEPTPPPDLEPSPLPAIASKPSTPNATTADLVGFQLDKIYDYQETTARLQITLYGSDGKVLSSGQSTASKRTEYCRSPFLKSVLGFALREVHFNDIKIGPNSFIVIEVYTPSSGGYLALTPGEETEEELVCWTALRLALLPQVTELLSRNSGRSLKPDLNDEEDLAKLNTGRHNITLYTPPLPQTRQLRSSFKNQQGLHGWEMFGQSYMTLFIFNKTFLPPPLPSDIPEFNAEDDCPEGAWVEGKERSTPSKVYKNGDGFELYIDEAMFLPDNCGFTKVVCSLYDSKYTKLKEEFENDINLDLSPHNPDFDLKFEFRDFSYPPTATIFIKVYMIEVLTKRAQRLGVAILPVFVKPGSLDRADDSDKKFCLNEGCYQLKLYNEVNNTNRLIRNSLESPVPCACLLVRLLPAPCHSDGQPKQAFEFLEDQWEREGLLVPKPPYASGQYDSSECSPSIMECRLFHSYLKRKPTTIREVLTNVMEGKKTKNDQGLNDIIKNLMKNLQSLPTADISYLSKYNSLHGLMFSVDGAQNLPWTGFTFATYCFSPPASFYKGKLDDPAVLVTKLDLDGLIRLPKWNDGFKVFPRRCSHSNLVVVVHLYELRILPNGNDPIYGFGSQAWTVIPVCNNDYPNHGYFQVGLFHDAPTVETLNLLENEPLIQTIANMRKRKMVKIVDGASVFIRIGDARRREELENLTKLTVRKTFLPRGNKFLNPVQSKKFASIIPANQNADEYGKVLSTKFKMLAGQAFQQRVQRE